MPIIPPRFQDSIGILYGKHTVSGARIAVGTAFLVTYKLDLASGPIAVLVTCKHCVSSATSVTFKRGYEIQFTKEDWAHTDLQYDVSVMNITELLPESMKNIGYIDRGELIDNNDLRFGLGSEIFMLGLHEVESASDNIYPRARFGYISGWAQERNPVVQGNGIEHPSHIGDMRSRSGFSGSPVFSWSEIVGLNGFTQIAFHFIGVHSGQFREKIAIYTNANEYSAEIASSMTVIVPSWQLEETFRDAI